MLLSLAQVGVAVRGEVWWGGYYDFFPGGKGEGPLRRCCPVKGGVAVLGGEVEGQNRPARRGRRGRGGAARGVISP